MAPAAPSAPPVGWAAPSETPAIPPVLPPVEPKTSLEERVGARWLARIGIVVLVLGAVFFFQFAAEQGWVSPVVRVVVVTVGGLGLIGLGELTLRLKMRVFAAAAFGGGLAMLYAAAYVASPNFFDLVSNPFAFGWMCVVTLIGVGL
ncbi:MAG: DUF2339 domain-containing protein, partial [Planctomycetota bacterium]